jgi:predicted dehydrogenase
VNICTPTDTHYEMVCRAAHAGKHIVCEKPLALTLEQGREMVRLCRQQGVRLYVAQVLRYYPEYARARQLAVSGELGRPGVIRLARSGYQFKGGRNTWTQDEVRSGGMILDLLVHDFDYARWVAGDVESVYARQITTETAGNHSAYAIAILRHQGGTLSNVAGGWVNPPPQFRTGLEIACERGLIHYESDETAALIARLEVPTGTQAAVEVTGSPLHENPYVLQLKDFIAYVEDGTPPRSTAVDALAALQVSLAACQSARSGQVVKLEILAEVAA